MFPDWISLLSTLQEERIFHNTLQALPREVIVEICKNVCKSLAPRPTSGPVPTISSTPGQSGASRTSLYSSSVTEDGRSVLQTEELVQYSMEVLCYALTLDFDLHEVIRDAASVYCDWLTVLTSTPKTSVPDCLRTNPNLFAQRIIKQLYNLFVPRKAQTSEGWNHQILLCHRVLRTLQDVFKVSIIIEMETWEVLMLTLLTITDAVLSPPAHPSDFAESFAKRLVLVLFDLWLTACQRCFPAAVYWKTFSQMSRTWCHRVALIDDWLRVSVMTFERMTHIMCGKSGLNSVHFRNSDQANRLAEWKSENIPNLPSHLLVQTQMRFLLLLGDVAEVAAGKQALRNEKMLQMMDLPEIGNIIEDSLARSALPVIFLKVMTGVTMMVDLALNMLSPVDTYLEITWPETEGLSYGTLSLLSKNRPLRCEARLACRGLLHLFGPWLFHASLIRQPEAMKSAEDIPEVALTESGDSLFTLPPESAVWQPGRAEAVGTLCRLFSVIADGANLPSGTVPRMGLMLAEALSWESISGFALSNAIRNCHDIFRGNLPGFESLLPVVVPALEMILLQKLPKKFIYPEINPEELRSAALHLLTSIICLPKYFDLLPFKDIKKAFLEPSGADTTTTEMESTFGSVYYRLLDLILNSIVNESNPANCMMMLGCLYILFVHPCMETNVVEDSPDIRFSYGQKVFIALAHLLSSSAAPHWLLDPHLSYACLDFLHTIASYSQQLLNATTCKMVILTISRYINDQSNQPSKAHSKDLHNKIIVAYNCLITWMVAWPSLLQDSEVLSKVSDVIEIGLTGTKNTKMLKTTQSFQPISTRVRDAAELALLMLVEVVGSNGDPGCYRYLDNLVTEEDILRHNPTAGSRFLYFIIDGTAVFTALCTEGSNGPLYIVQRSLSCRRAFYMEPVKTTSMQGSTATLERLDVASDTSSISSNSQLNPAPASTITAAATPPPPPVSVLANNLDWDFTNFRSEIPGYNKIERCLADDMLPTFADIDNLNEAMAKEIQALTEIFDHVDKENVFSLPHSDSAKPYVPPVVEGPVTADSEAIVMSQVLYRLGLKPPTVPSPSMYHTPYTVQLDHHNPSLQDALGGLDKLSVRPLDWIFAFCVKANDHSLSDILANGSNIGKCSQAFLRFLTSIAWPVKVSDLLARDVRSYESTDSESLPKDVMRIDGQEWCLLRVDTCQELGLIVPSAQSVKTQHFFPISEASDLTNALALSSGVTGSPRPGIFDRAAEISQKTAKVRSYSVDDIDSVNASPYPLKSALAPQQRPRKPSVLTESRFVPIVVWMESFQDNFVFPGYEMLKTVDAEHLFSHYHGGDDIDSCTQSTEFRLIYIYPAAHGMYEVRLRNVDNNPIPASVPLVNGMILSHNILGNMIRDCAVNMMTRKRLSQESYVPGQIRRRTVIQDICNRFRLKSVTESSWGP